MIEIRAHIKYATRRQPVEEAQGTQPQDQETCKMEEPIKLLRKGRLPAVQHRLSQLVCVIILSSTLVYNHNLPCRENRRWVADEPVEFQKEPVEVGDLMRIIDNVQD